MVADFKSLYDMFEAIPDEQAAINYFKAIRWKNGEHCPYCGHDKLYAFTGGRTLEMRRLRQRFSIRVGTILRTSKIPLRKASAAIWLITSHRKWDCKRPTRPRPQANAKERMVRIVHRLVARCPYSSLIVLCAEVEVDEAFFGGKEKNKHAHLRGTDDKVVVLTVRAWRRTASAAA
ncbi:MAG: IS1595 family transposase [Xanthobacteraceae bacterium]